MTVETNLVQASRDDLRRLSLLAQMLTEADGVGVTVDTKKAADSIEKGFPEAHSELVEDLNALVSDGLIAHGGAVSDGPENYDVLPEGERKIQALRKEVARDRDCRDAVIGTQILSVLKEHKGELRGIVEKLCNMEINVFGAPVNKENFKDALTTLEDEGLVDLHKAHQGIIGASTTKLGRGCIRMRKSIFSCANEGESSMGSVNVNFNGSVGNFVGANSGELTQVYVSSAELEEHETNFYQAMKELDESLEGHPDLRKQLKSLVDEYRNIDSSTDQDGKTRQGVLGKIKEMLFVVAAETRDYACTKLVAGAIEKFGSIWT